MTTERLVIPLLPHKEAYRRRVLEEDHGDRRSSSLADQLLDPTLADPLYQDLGGAAHYVDLWLGCPNPQRVTVMVDTTSGITGLPCDTCPALLTESTPQCSLVSGRHQYPSKKSACFHFLPCNDQSDTEDIAIPMGSCSSVSEAESGSPEVYLWFNDRLNDGYYKIGQKYSDGSSWAGHVAMDKAYTGGMHEEASEKGTSFVPFFFGCQETISSGPTYSSTLLADGILGMNRNPSSYWRQWVAMTQDGPNKKRLQVHPSSQFSLCFVINPDVKTNDLMAGFGAGAMVLGGMEPRLNKTPMAYAQMLPDRSDFVVWIERIYLRKGGGTSVAATQESTVVQVPAKPPDLNNGKVVLDSVSLGFWLSESLEEAFMYAWKILMHSVYEKDRTYSEEELESLPTILIQLSPRDKSKDIDPNQPGLSGRDKLDPVNLRSVVVALPPSRYMIQVPKSGYKSQLLFTVRDGRHQTLGAHLFAGHNIHFDIKKERIGFAESDCNYWSLGNANFVHTPHEGPLPTAPPTVLEEDIVEEVQDVSNWMCGGLSCGTAAGLLVALALILLCVACCRRCCARKSGSAVVEVDEDDEYSDGPRFRDEEHDDGEGEESDEADESDEEESFELTPIQSS